MEKANEKVCENCCCFTISELLNDFCQISHIIFYKGAMKKLYTTIMKLQTVLCQIDVQFNIVKL